MMNNCCNCVLFCFRNGFNILLYGLGSKRVLLDQFRTSKLSSHLQIVVNGYFPSLTIKNVSLVNFFNGVAYFET